MTNFTPTLTVAVDPMERMRERLDLVLEENKRLREELVPSEPFFPLRWRLTATESKILAFLMARAPMFRSKEQILDAVRRDHRNPPMPKIVDVYMTKIRAKVHHHGILIETKWGVGYGLTPEMAQRLRDLCAAEQRGEDTTPNHSVILLAGGHPRAAGNIEVHAWMSSPAHVRKHIATLHKLARERWPQMVQEDEEAFLRACLR